MAASGILKNSNLSENININYPIEFTSTESYAGGTLLYINNKLSYKHRQVLCTLYLKIDWV